jgi:feruloyl esterase
MNTIRRRRSQRTGLAALAAALLAALAPAPPAAAAGKWPEPSGLPVHCSDLATDPAHGLAGNPVIKSVSSAVIPMSGGNQSHCQVNVRYGTSPEQNINIRVGLPLNSLDGGAGGVEGAWNGRTQGIGGGGCAGNLNVTGPVNTGYVGSGTDTGHVGGNCEPGVNEDGTYNLQFIQDFIRNAIKQQVLLSKGITRAYYGMAPAYNYWNGCSTGGRQG